MKKFAIPEGTRDLILGECSLKKALQKEIEAVFDSYGYKEIITPSIEFYQTYQVGFDNVKDESMYKFFDHNGRILTLRMDMTVPIVRVATTRFKDQKPPFRFQYCANVYKVKESFAGKRNEVTDCGIELLGQSAEESDLEILVCACEVMEKLKQDAYTLELGNINFFHSACSDLHLDEEDIKTLADLIDRKSMSELSSFLESLALSEEVQTFFLQLPWLCGDVEVLKEALPYCFHPKLRAIIAGLKELYDQLKELGYEKHITFDLGKVPHLNYYSGLLFEGFVEGIGTSVLSGGRYDTLAEKFGSPMPAIGFSVKLDYVLPVLEKVATKQPSVRLCYPMKAKVKALQKAKELRKDHIVELLQDEAYEDVCVIKEDVR